MDIQRLALPGWHPTYRYKPTTHLVLTPLKSVFFTEESAMAERLRKSSHANHSKLPPSRGFFSISTFIWIPLFRVFKGKAKTNSAYKKTPGEPVVFHQPILKKILYQIGNHLPQGSVGENKTYLSCHHLPVLGKLLKKTSLSAQSIHLRMHGINGSQQGSKGCTQGEAEFHPPNGLHPAGVFLKHAETAGGGSGFSQEKRWSF